MKKAMKILLVLILGIGGGFIMFVISEQLGVTPQFITVVREETTESEEDTKETGSVEKVQRYVSNYIFVGDSRYVAMETLFKQENDVFICKEGEGFYFFNTHLDEIKYNLDKDSVIIIGMGVNDLVYGIDDYIRTVNQLADEVPCKVCYMTVNPVDDEKIAQTGYNITNEEVDKFNARLYSDLNDKISIIDSNTYLKEIGYNTMDGLHYDNDTYEKIYWYLKREASMDSK